MKSQLKFHYSGDLPVYATSLIHAMDGRSDSDLNGVRFADAPWVIAPQNWIARLPDLFAEHFPDERRLARLHAMGYDAYQLAGSLYGYRAAGAELLDGASGRLYVDADGRVHRRLAWAEFRNGTPDALPDADEAGPGDAGESNGDIEDLDEWNRETDTPGIDL